MSRFENALNWAMFTTLLAALGIEKTFGVSAYWGITVGVLVSVLRYVDKTPPPPSCKE